MPALCPFPRLGNFFSPQIQFGMMSLEKCWAGGLSSVMAPHLLPLPPVSPRCGGHTSAWPCGMAVGMELPKPPFTFSVSSYPKQNALKLQPTSTSLGDVVKRCP